MNYPLYIAEHYPVNEILDALVRFGMASCGDTSYGCTLIDWDRTLLVNISVPDYADYKIIFEGSFDEVKYILKSAIGLLTTQK